MQINLIPQQRLYVLLINHQIITAVSPGIMRFLFGNRLLTIVYSHLPEWSASSVRLLDNSSFKTVYPHTPQPANTRQYLPLKSFLSIEEVQP